MAQITIVANIRAKNDEIERVKKEILQLIDITRAEEGCITYVLHWDNEDKTHFMLYEIWESWKLWQKHRYNDHMVAFREATKDVIEEFTVNQMTQIG